MSKLNLNSTDHQLFKELSGGHSFTLTERVEGEYRGINKPKLLTSLIAPSVNTHRTRSFIYDVEEKTAQMFSGKSYSEKGGAIEKDGASQLTFAVPSFGLTFNVLPQDYDGKRIPNSSEMMSAEYVVGKQMELGADAMDLLNEVGMADIIVNDTNYLSDTGPGTSYDYSQYITGTSRAAAKDIDFDALDALGVRRAIVAERKVIEQRLGLSGKSASGFVLICGDVAFECLLEAEAQLDLARPLENSLDVASMGIETIGDGSSSFRYDNFKSQSGVQVVNYGATIIGGNKVIEDNAAYLLPVGVSNMITIELAPAMVSGIVNTEAEPMYVFTEEGLRTGVSTEIETNRLFLNRNPELITAINAVKA